MQFFNYKVLKVFSYGGRDLRAGEEIVLSERDGSIRENKGLVTRGRDLDPADEKDKAAIDAAEEAHDAEHAEGVAKDEAREEGKQEELGDDDTKRKALLEEAETLMTSIAEADGKQIDQKALAKIARAETNDIEKHVEELRAEKAKLDKDEEPEEEKPTPRERG